MTDKTRTLEEVTKEYSMTCMQLGEKVFQTKLLQHEIADLNNKLTELNEEAGELKKAKK